MYSIKIDPKYNKYQNPKIGLIALASDYMIEKDFINVIKDKKIDFFVNRIECFNPLTSENLIKMSEKITDLNDQNKKIISNHSPDIIFVYSLRSGESFIEITRNHSLYPLMTGSKVMCISDKIASLFKSDGWKKVEVFNPGEELLKL